jgi:hypothetical protein
MPASTVPFSECLQVCVDCLLACQQYADFCLDHPDASQTVRLCRDCADLASVTLSFVARQSPLAGRLGAALADACAACADECARRDDNLARICTRACDRCGDVFREA